MAHETNLDQFEVLVDSRFDEIEELIKDLHDMTDERLSEIEPYLCLIERFLHYLATKEEETDE